MDDQRIRASIEAYVEAWNEVDATRRAELLARACSEDLYLRTPGKRIHGRAELDAMIAEYQRRRPGERAAFASAIEVQGTAFRYAGRIEGASVPRGEALDVGECDDDGRIRLLLTFVGLAPPPLP